MSVLNDKSVLIVDDSHFVREQLSKYYTSLNMIVKGIAKNGVEAIQLLRSEKYDLISLDIIMPEMNGIECYHAIRENNPNQVCVFFTYLASDPTVMEHLKKILPEGHIFEKNIELPDTRSRLESIVLRSVNKSPNSDRFVA